MKKLEILLGLFAGISLVLDYFQVPFASLLMLVSIPVLSLFYFYLSFALINGIGFKGLFVKASYKGVSAFMIVLAIIFGVFLSNFILGILFGIKEFPGANILLLIGFIVMAIVLFLSGAYYFKSQKAFFNRMFVRFVIYDVIAIISLYVSGSVHSLF